MGSDAALSTSEYVRRHRLDANISVEQLAARVGVSASWLTLFEAGEGTEELTYDLLLALVRATQPARPEWWDDGHEHDLQLGPVGAPEPDKTGPKGYWTRIEAVRTRNRSNRVGR